MENPIMDRVKNEARNLKVLYEELQVQMSLGKAEARDMIERERKALSDYMRKQRDAVQQGLEDSADDRRVLLTCVEDLEAALSAEVPNKVRAYDTYKRDLLQRVYRLEEVVRASYPTLSENMQEVLDGFKSKMDAFRVNLALHDKDDPERVERIRNEFMTKIEEVRQLLAEREMAKTRLDHFMEDMSQSFNYLKRAISDLAD
jgi:chromosome segregation ATPase